LGTLIDNARLTEKVQTLLSGSVGLEATERERNRIAQDMHDGLAQTLAASRMKADAAAVLLNAGEIKSAVREIGDISRISGDLLQDVRETTARLRSGAPSGIASIGLVARRLSDFESETGCDVVREWQVEPSELILPSGGEDQIAWIFQECLRNIRKHVPANQVVVRIRYRDEIFLITVTDDGVGFVPGKSRTIPGEFGPATMRERTAELNGRIRIKSSAGRGTSVSLPVSNVLKR
jgi:signal transduction histidine kinase